MTGGVPSAAIRRSTSTPATTFRAPSSQPPFGTESMCPPIRRARSEAPRSVNHWLPAASIVSSAPVPSTFPRSHSRARSQVSVQATRWAPFSSPVGRSSWSSATVRFVECATAAPILSPPGDKNCSVRGGAEAPADHRGVGHSPADADAARTAPADCPFWRTSGARHVVRSATRVKKWGALVAAELRRGVLF